ncbi:unnamed protein product [Cyprideis torosa]|uniref:Protein preY, mitochondrial n=1 Tax=Cyprideis torosa TaxID=163714 RepID=A0A7R8ZYW7_9CRUS|nr:unnamed protein product [Cyprideis torosa]CAG0909081.1 unnamed protein product [Cyprideis torosa]
MFLEANNMEADWDGVSEADNETLVNTLSMMSPYGPAEKQALLEAEDLKTRAETLIAMTEIALALGPGPMPDQPLLDPKMLQLLVCPHTKYPLEYDEAAQELVSLKAKLAYPVRDGVPILLISEARPLED